LAEIHRFLGEIDTNMDKYILIGPIFFIISVEAGSLFLIPIPKFGVGIVTLPDCSLFAFYLITTI